MRKETEFRQQRCWNCKKKYERGKISDVMVEGEKTEFQQWDYRNSCYPKLLPKWVWSAWSASVRWSAQRETNYDNQVVEIVGKGGERKYELWQPSCRKWEEKKLWQLICGNGIAEIEGKKIVAIDLWQWNCRNKRKKKFCGIENWRSQSAIHLTCFSDSYSPKYLEYIHWSFPIKPNLLISRPKSMSRILFCLFISPLRNKRQVPSLKDCIFSQSYILRLFSYSSALL